MFMKIACKDSLDRLKIRPGEVSRISRRSTWRGFAARSLHLGSSWRFFDGRSMIGVGN